MRHFPSNKPLLALTPLEAPLKIIELFKKSQQREAVPSKKIQINLKSPKKQDYEQLYKQKCQQLIESLQKCKYLQSNLQELKHENQELQFQIKRLQEDKWQKCSTFRQSENRKRSKSSKKMTPTIEVKVPNRLEKESQECLEEENRILKQEIECLKKKCIQLQREVTFIKQQQSDGKAYCRSKKIQKIGTNSPQNYPQIYPDFDKKKDPYISEFSPNQDTSINTVKKDTNYHQDLEFEIKRLKNELLYKELLLDKLKEQSQKQNSVLQTHLKLSVEESKKVSETTSQVINMFKKEIVELWRELQQEKSRNTRLEQEMRGKFTYESEVKSKWVPSEDNNTQQYNLLSLLQVRRNQKVE